MVFIEKKRKKEGRCQTSMSIPIRAAVFAGPKALNPKVRQSRAQCLISCAWEKGVTNGDGTDHSSSASDP